MRLVNSIVVCVMFVARAAASYMAFSCDAFGRCKRSVIHLLQYQPEKMIANFVDYNQRSVTLELQLSLFL